MKPLDDLFDPLWLDYIRMNGQAEKICNILKDEGETIVNDHIAFRTFNHPKITIDILAHVFVESGYCPKGEYTFTEKKLHAKHYEHENVNFPKIFISELKLELFSQELQSIVHALVAQIDEKQTRERNFILCGVPWNPISYSTYEKIREESEYAAWMTAFGFRANHFTILVNALKKYHTLEKLNHFLKENGFFLNSSGGEIKGSPNVYLEQSSTLADSVNIHFEDRVARIPGCYYEFAKRYPLPDGGGKLFSGFIARSADKIFESTDFSTK